MNINIKKSFYIYFLFSLALLAKDEKPSFVVESLKIVPTKFVIWRKYIGNIEAANFSLLKMKESGTIASILVTPGQSVKKGQILVTLKKDSDEKAFLLLEKNAKIKEKELLKYKELYKKGDISKLEYDKIKTEHNRVLAESLSKKSLILSSKIESPFDGIVGVPQVFVGNFVTSETPIITVQRPPFYIKFKVPASRLSEIEIKQKIKLIEKNIEGSIEAVEKSIDPKTRTGFAIARIDDCKNCLVNESVNVNVHISEKEQAIVIPKTAIFYDNGKTKLYKIEGDIVKSIDVIIGQEQNDQVLVVSGLKEKDEIVLINPKRLFDGAKIKVFK